MASIKTYTLRFNEDEISDGAYTFSLKDRTEEDDYIYDPFGYDGPRIEWAVRILRDHLYVNTTEGAPSYGMFSYIDGSIETFGERYEREDVTAVLEGFTPTEVRYIENVLTHKWSR